MQTALRPSATNTAMAGDLITAAAVDPDFYARTWFPRTVRQGTPAFHQEVDDTLERPENTHIAIEAFRGSAKTTKLRLFTSRRIAYGLSRTILFLSDTENHVLKSIAWLANNIERNTPWTTAFGLSRGKKWTENEIEIVHGIENYTIRVIGLGITGQIRGINVEDYRPDLIIADDVENEENTATPEQRNKISNLFFGAVMKSLTPVSENPHTKLVALGTPLDRDCLVESLRRDPQFVSRRYGCFNQLGESRWPERFSTAHLLKEKQSYIQRNKLSVWLREMECRVISPETCAFRPDSLQYWDALPKDLTYVIVVDPAPARSAKAVAKNRDTDFQAVMIVGFKAQDIYVCEYAAVRDQNPEEFGGEFMRLCLKYHPRLAVVESVAYQKMLAWYLKEHMRRNNYFVPIREFTDRRPKVKRIMQTITEPAGNGRLFVHKSHIELIQQFVDYPDVSHDDVLDALSMALTCKVPGGGIMTQDPLHRTTKPLAASWRAAP